MITLPTCGVKSISAGRAGLAAYRSARLGNRQLAVVIAVVAVRVMQTAVDEIVDVITMRHPLVTAAAPVLMTGVMAPG